MAKKQRHNMNGLGGWMIVSSVALLLGAAGCESAPATPTTAPDASTAAAAAETQDTQAAKVALEKDLTDLATLAGQLLDGDECHAVLSDRTWKLLFRPDPRDQWAAGDNFEYNIPVAIRVKKMLIRLALTRGYKCDCNLWLNCPEKPHTVLCAIKQVNNCCPYTPWGTLTQDTPDPIAAALQGKIAVGTPNADAVSVFAPIRDSLGDIVGAVECSSRLSFFTAAHKK